MTEPIKRPALRYYGGKWRIAPWVISHFPMHKIYIEPFAGAASILLQKAPAPFEVMNDLDGNVVNFFRVLRERTAELRRAIEFTPFSREEVALSAEPSDDSLEAARRLYIRAWQTMHGAPSMDKGGWRFGRRGQHDKQSVVSDWNDHDRLPAIALRLKNVQIDRGPAVDVIRRFDKVDALIYCDPPYVRSTRSDRWGSHGYSHEMKDEDHRELAEVLHSATGMVILSGYPSKLWEELYGDWKHVSMVNRTNRGKPATEYLWISPAAAAAAKPGVNLFDRGTSE